VTDFPIFGLDVSSPVSFELLTDFAPHSFCHGLPDMSSRHLHQEMVVIRLLVGLPGLFIAQKLQNFPSSVWTFPARFHLSC
jgi:hypothetical protein